MEYNFFENLFKMFKVLFHPLSKIRNNCENGDQVFQYLYFERNGIEDKIESAIDDNSNITIVGKPGQGKTSLMHYMFIELNKRKDLYPIIIDYRELGIRNLNGIILDFVVKLREYFKIINHPFNQLTEETNIENCHNHIMLVTTYLEGLSTDLLIPRLVIFLDDLDYAQDFYLEVLQEYFLPYAASDKVIVILSVRKPLHNSIVTNEQLRHCYYIKPHEINFPDGNLKLLVQNRLLSVLKHCKKRKSHSFIDRFRMAFNQSKLDKILFNYAKKMGVVLKIENGNEVPDLPFNNAFYAKLSNITYFNLRTIEQLLPNFIKRELKKGSPSFNENFYDAFIHETFKEDLILLDLVKEKSTGLKKKQKENSILQNILEYFYFNENKNRHFYETQDAYGITSEEADKGLKILTEEPYSLINPEYVYSSNSHTEIYEHYFINIKGVVYVEQILQNELYYELKKVRKSNRSYYYERSET
ncbi:MAG: hypothetical protein GQ564_13865 [Bacteroidales bacterium]|nr:hypothetical protein [Bacteroidales bacterium]